MTNKNDYFHKPPYRLIYHNGYKSLDSKFRWKPLVKEVMKYKKEGKLLDIGCAYGFLLRQFPASFEKFGVDMSEIAVNNSRLNNPTATVKLGDFNKVKLEKGFDVITAFETLEHLPKLSKSIGKVYSLLKKGGYFFSSFPIVENIFEKRWFTLFDKTHINPSDKIIKEISRKFKIVNKKYTFDCVKFIILPKFRTFPVHQSYFIVAQKK